MKDIAGESIAIVATKEHGFQFLGPWPVADTQEMVTDLQEMAEKLNMNARILVVTIDKPPKRRWF